MKSNSKKAIQGLSFVSETDAPFLVMTRANFPIGNIDKLFFEDFFEPLTQYRDWFGEAEEEQRGRFARLRDLMADKLSNLQVVKISKSETESFMFIYGADINTGKFAGIETLEVAT